MNVEPARIAFATFIRVVVRAVEVCATDDDVETARDDDGDVESARRARDEDEDDARWNEDAWWRHDDRTIGTEGERRRRVVRRDARRAVWGGNDA